jgi:hypothetical protein
LRVAHRLHNDRLVRVLALLVAVTAPACFYVDPVNERPSGTIERVDLNPPMRGGSTDVSAKWSDPDGDNVTFAWTAQACAADGVTCDNAFLTGTQDEFPISPIPTTLADGKTPVAKLSISVEITDVHGAEARPVPALLLDVTDAAPSVDFQWAGHQWNNNYPVNLPITVIAQKSDPDDSLDNVTLSWDPPYSPNPTPHTLAWTDIPPDPMHPHPGIETKKFTPDSDGPWTVHIKATDLSNQSSDRSHDIPIAADQPPCLGQTDPILTTDTIVVDQARRFSVYTVDDDIDPYPGPPPSEGMGTSTFAWSLASPASGGALVPLTTDESGVLIDPADYAPGDQLDLRVVVSDRVQRTLGCDPSTPQCSIGGTTCLQRQTWHVEIR